MPKNRGGGHQRCMTHQAVSTEDAESNAREPRGDEREWEGGNSYCERSTQLGLQTQCSLKLKLKEKGENEQQGQ